MISGLFPSIIHYSLPAALFPFSAIHTTISCSFLLQVCSLISTLSLLEKGSWPQTLKDWKPPQVQDQGFDVFFPLLLYSHFKSLLSDAVEPKPQNTKELNLYRTARKTKAFPQSGSLWCQLLLFYHAISPTYTQSFNYRSKGSTATNLSFRASLVPCSVQAVRAQLSHKWLIPPSGRVSPLAHAVLLSVTAVLPFSCSNLQWQWDDTTHKHSKHYPKWRKLWALFWTVHHKE